MFAGVVLHNGFDQGKVMAKTGVDLWLGGDNIVAVIELLAAEKQIRKRIVVQRVERGCDLRPDIVLGHYQLPGVKNSRFFLRKLESKSGNLGTSFSTFGNFCLKKFSRASQALRN